MNQDIPWVSIIEAMAPGLGLPVDLIRCQIAQESGTPGQPGTGNPGAISNEGAIGLMQIEPKTALYLLQKYPQLMAEILKNDFCSLVLGTAYDHLVCAAAAKKLGLEGAELIKGMLAAYNGGPVMLEIAHSKFTAQNNNESPVTMDDLAPYLPDQTRKYYQEIWATFEQMQNSQG